MQRKTPAPTKYGSKQMLTRNTGEIVLLPGKSATLPSAVLEHRGYCDGNGGFGPYSVRYNGHIFGKDGDLFRVRYMKKGEKIRTDSDYYILKNVTDSPVKVRFRLLA